MGLVRLHDRDRIERFLSRDLYLNLYAIGDLDEFFWPRTTWYGWVTGGQISAIVLVYQGPEVPTLLGLSNDQAPMHELLSSIRQVMPPRFYAHFSPGLESVFGESHSIEFHGDHFKMALRDGITESTDDLSQVVRLDATDLPSIEKLYRESYPGNWFDSRMLETGQYYGIKEGGRVVSIAGIHVYSTRYRVAALGNIATLPSHRNRGYASQVTATLCHSLRGGGIRVGLNVKSDNSAALACYERIGFETVTSYGEFTLQRKR